MWGALAGAALGAISGAQGSKSSTNSSQSTSVNLRNFDDINKGRSGLEELGYNQQVSQFQNLMGLVNAGPGQSEVESNTSFQNNFANQLQTLLGQIGNQSPANIAQNYSQAQGLFAPEQTALNQQFQDQSTESNRLAARLGRAGNDPIMRNKLMQEQTRQQTMLNSQMGSYARQLPEIQANQVLNLGGQLSNLRQGLATQALQNRQTLMSMGNQLANSERNYRLQTAGHTTNSTTTEKSGGGLGGAISGALGGAGAFMSMGGSFGGGSGGMSTPTRQAMPSVGSNRFLTNNYG